MGWTDHPFGQGKHIFSTILEVFTNCLPAVIKVKRALAILMRESCQETVYQNNVQ